MASIREITDGFFLIDTMGYGYEKTVACYLVKGSAGSALVDPGYSASLKTVLRGLDDARVGLDELLYVISTHVHLDHSGAVGSLLKVLQRAQAVTAAGTERLLSDPTRLVRAARILFGPEIAKYFGHTEPVPGKRIRTVADGDRLQLGEESLRIVSTPGHTPLHLSILAEKSRAVFTGDAVCSIYPDFSVPVPAGSPPSYDVGSAVRSIEKLKSLEPKVLLTPHFGEREPSESYFKRNVEAILGWKNKIEKLLRDGLNRTRIEEGIVDDLLKLDGRQAHMLPEYYRKILLSRMVGISVSGYLGYLQKLS